MIESKEIRFEQDIETSLVNYGGWDACAFSNLHFDASKGIDLSTLIQFVQATQPKAWKRYENIFKSDAPDKFYKRFNEVVNAEGMLYVLRHGFKDVVNPKS